MSEAPNHNVAAAPTAANADAVIRLAMVALIRGRPPQKVRKLAARWLEAAEELEDRSRRCAGVYPINGGGKAYGERPGDLDAQEAARIIGAFAHRILNCECGGA